MKQIWKYPLEPGWTDIEMPKNADILSFQCQKNIPTIWVLVNPSLVCDGEKEHRTFVIYGTGHNIGNDELKYVGTTQQYDGDLVWHLFEERN